MIDQSTILELPAKILVRTYLLEQKMTQRQTNTSPKSTLEWLMAPKRWILERTAQSVGSSNRWKSVLYSWLNSSVLSPGSFNLFVSTSFG